MRRIFSILLALALMGGLLLTGCGVLVPDSPESAEPARPITTCSGVTPATCREAIALVGAAGLAPDVQLASAIIVADTCPPNARCDREFAIELAVVIIPADSSRAIVALLVSGRIRPEQVADWQGPLPAHVQALLPTR